MIQAIKISRDDHIHDAELSNLSKINIFCGKNNSGKSTLLNTISSGSDEILFGKKYNFQELWRIFEEIMHEISIENNEKDFWVEDLPENYFSTLNQVLQAYTKDYYFLSDLYMLGYQIYEKKLNGLYDSIYSQIRQKISDKAVSIFLYIDKNEILYIPASRMLETNSNYSIQNRQVESNGSGLVNQLLYMKSQLEGSNEKETFLKMKKQFKYISDGCDFDIVINGDGTLRLMFTNPSGQWLEAEKCGLGLRDLLILLFFANNIDNKKLILVDEVETHIHPDMQRKLLYILKEESKKQFFITTHSNIFLDSTFVNKIFHITFDEKISIVDATSRSMVLNDLGFSVSDNLTSDLIILCEGPSDKPVLEEFLYKFGMMQNYNIKIWPLGGDIMDKHDLSVFSESYNIIGLIDMDPGSRVIRDRFVEKCKQNNIPVHKLERYAIENYFTVEALRAVFKGQISEGVTTIDPNIKLEEQIGLNPKNNNRKIAKVMEISDIEGTDLYNFFVEVQEKLKSL